MPLVVLLACSSSFLPLEPPTHAKVLAVVGHDQLSPSDGATRDFFGYDLEAAGDLDGDGYQDVVVGAYGDDDAVSDGGSAYLYYGSASGLDPATEQELLAPDGHQDQHFGYAVAGAGDVNGDGYDDVVVGAPYDDAVVSYGGVAYVEASDWQQSADFGISVSSAGDLNGDGHPDMVVGASGQEVGFPERGAAYVYFGTVSGLSEASEQQIVASDGGWQDEFGSSVAGGGPI